jgi:ligand-binding sensor domain-containing protein
MRGPELRKYIALPLLLLLPVILFGTPAGSTILKKGWLEGQWSYLTTADGLSSNTILSIAVEGSSVWFGTYAGGASCYDTGTGTWKAFTTKWQPASPKKTKPGLNWENTLEDNHVVAIAVDKPGEVWFGTTFYGLGDVCGVSRFVRRPSERWSVFGLADGITCNDITSIATDADGVWVGTQKGLARYARETRTWTFFDKPKALARLYINSIAVDPETVWIGSGSGVGVLDKKTGQWTWYTTTDGLPEDSVQALAFEGDRVWAGGTYGHLAVFSRPKRIWTPVSAGDGLDDKWIKNLLFDGRVLWVARDGGVSCCELATGKWVSLTTADGLPADQVNAVARDGEAIWFGTSAGAARLALK